MKIMEKLISTLEDTTGPRPNHTVAETSPQRNSHSPDFNTEATDQTTRGRYRLLNISLLASLSCLADKAETNPIDKILSILQNETCNSKTVRDLTADMEAF